MTPEMTPEVPDPGQEKARKDEQRQLAYVREDLVREFTAVPPDVVDEKLGVLVSAFQRAPVRSFVPVLVRRQAREQLRHLT
jgi:hypothetical protein